MAIGRAAAALSALASTGTLATVNGSADGGVWPVVWAMAGPRARHRAATARSMAKKAGIQRSEEHTSELQSLMRISYAVFCLKKKKKTTNKQRTDIHHNLVV